MSARPARREKSALRAAVESLEGRSLLTAWIAQPDYYVSNQAGAVTLPVMVAPTDPTNPTQSVKVVTSDGTAKAGVDYTAVSRTLTSESTAPSVPVSIPILVNSPNSAERTFTVSASTDAAGDYPAKTTVHIVNRTDLVPPHVVSTRMVAKGQNVKSVVITFSKDMAPGPVSDPANYMILDATRMKLGPAATKTVEGLMAGFAKGKVAVTSAVYDPATHSVTLTPARKVRATPFLSVADGQIYSDPNRVAKSPLTDTAGNLLDSMNTGVPDGILNASNFQKWLDGPTKPAPHPHPAPHRRGR
jgi:hypothetical protein